MKAEDIKQVSFLVAPPTFWISFPLKIFCYWCIFKCSVFKTSGLMSVSWSGATFWPSLRSARSRSRMTLQKSPNFCFFVSTRRKWKLASWLDLSFGESTTWLIFFLKKCCDSTQEINFNLNNSITVWGFEGLYTVHISHSKGPLFETILWIMSDISL